MTSRRRPRKQVLLSSSDRVGKVALGAPASTEPVHRPDYACFVRKIWWVKLERLFVLKLDPIWVGERDLETW